MEIEGTREIERKIEEEINNPEEFEYFIHRTNLGDIWIDPEEKKILTFEEYIKLEEIDIERANSCYTYGDLKKFGLEWLGISDIDNKLKEKEAQNFQEQIQSFFKKGIYALEKRIDRTATCLGKPQVINMEGKTKKISPKEALKEILLKKDFGFNTSKSNSIFSAFSNRDELNTLILLQIPKEYLKNREENNIFEEDKEGKMFLTAYRQGQMLKNIIPSKFIKCAFYTSKVKNKEQSFLIEENPYFKENLKQKNITQQIGKATINTPTKEKDEIQEKINSEIKEREQDKKQEQK